MFPDLPKSRTCHCLFSCQVMSDSFATPWTVAHQAPLSMGFSRQECCSGVLFSPPGDLFALGIKPASPALQVDSLPSEPPGLGHYFSPYHGWMNEVKSIDLEEAEWWEPQGLSIHCGHRPASMAWLLTLMAAGSLSDGAPCLRHTLRLLGDTSSSVSEGTWGCQVVFEDSPCLSLAQKTTPCLYLYKDT